MIKGKVVQELAELTDVFPKFLVSAGDFEYASVIETQQELDGIGMQPGSFLIEPVGPVPPGSVYTVYGVDNKGESFVIQTKADDGTEAH
jgi:hypothetical protein